jgi:hypothetical protein
VAGLRRDQIVMLDLAGQRPAPALEPGRDRGVGVFALVATDHGLWIGSDTERIGRYEHHGRIAFMPLAGGTEVPEPRVGTLPGDLFRLGLDGTMTRSPFSGTAAGPSSPAATGIDWSTVRGAFAVNGRLYYTLSADPRLFDRWFTPQSGTIGAETFVASGAGDGRNWSTVAGMTMASARLTYATTTGTLSTVDFSGGLPTGPVTAVSGRPSRPLLAVPCLFVLTPAA